MSNALRTIDHEPARSAITPLEMLDRALSSGADADTLAKLMALQERWEAGQARKAFDEAIAAAKADITPIVRNAKGNNNKAYADFSAIARAVDPVISRHGLSYRFRTTQTDRISVTCVLSHKSGHFEETTLSGPADSSGNKNAIQAIGSTLTYLQRYSLVQALGLAAAHDDDGKAAGQTAEPEASITEAQASVIRELIEKAELQIEKFCEHWKVEALPDIPKAKFNEVVASLRRRIAHIQEQQKGAAK